MPEFRQNPATKEWVIMAPDRAGRPNDFKREIAAKPPLSAYREDCPFCTGNESQTEEPVYSYPAAGDWQVRVVPNKFAALQPTLGTTRTTVGSFLAAKGFGIAEVVIEHPRHDHTLATMSVPDILQVLRAYRERQIDINRNDRINLVTIFRNYGARAGTSLEHPHSQIIATPIVPPHVRYPMEQAVMYYDEHGSCVYCDIVREELRQEERIVTESESFAAFCPYASRSPFECRIYPKYHSAAFFLEDDEHLVELASVLKEILLRLRVCLNNPDYNYVIRSAPIGDHDARHLHWYMVIIPKVAIRAGFEIGTGIYINSVAPEDAARYLRESEITE